MTSSNPFGNNYDPDKPGFGDGAGGTDINRMHDYDDRDTGSLAHHHTLGLSNAQSSPGDHVHDGRQSKKLQFADVFPGQPVRMLQARINAAANVTINNAVADIPGVSLNFSVKNPNALAIVSGVIDFNISVAAAGALALGTLLLDGSTILNSLSSVQQIICDLTTIGRKTLMQSWLVELGLAGNHNLKMQSNKNTASGTVVMNSGAAVAHTGMTILLLDVDPT